MRVDSLAVARHTERNVAGADGNPKSSVLFQQSLRDRKSSAAHRLSVRGRGPWAPWRAALGIGLAVGMSLSLANPAAAGPNEAPRQFSYNPMVPDFWVLKYQYSGGGLLVSTDGGASWGMMCGDAYDGMSRPKETYGMAVAADGSMFLGDFSGLLVGHDQACSWNYDPTFEGFWVSDLQLDPLDPTRVFAVTSSGGKANALWAYDSGSQTWSQLGPQEELTISSLFVVPRAEDGLRIYESVTRSDPETFEPSFFLRYSDDEGTTWTESDYPDLTADWLLIVAADTNNPDRMVVVEKFGSDDTPDRVMLSEEAGVTGSFRVLTDDCHYGGAVFDPAGVLYVGRSTGGITVVRTPGGEPEYMDLFVEGMDNSVVKPSPRTLDYHGELGLLSGVLEDFGTINTETGEFVSMLNFRQIERFHTCEGRDFVQECSGQLNFDAWCVHPGFDVAPFCVDAYPGLRRAGGPTGPAMMPATDSGGSAGPSTSAPDESGAGAGGQSNDPVDDLSQSPAGASADQGATSGEPAASSDSSSGSCKVGTGMGGGSAMAGWLLTLGAALLLRRRR